MYGILDERQTTMKAFIRMGYLRLVHSWNIISILSILGFQSAKWLRSYWFCSERKCNGHVTPPNRMNFRKKSKRPSTPLIFGKWWCKFFWIWLHMCEEVWWPDTIEIQKCLPESVSCIIILNTIVENNIPWTLKLRFCINFMIKKPCLKFPKSAI